MIGVNRCELNVGYNEGFRTLADSPRGIAMSGRHPKPLSFSTGAVGTDFQLISGVPQNPTRIQGFSARTERSRSATSGTWMLK
jgi:hypothetical protein